MKNNLSNIHRIISLPLATVLTITLLILCWPVYQANSAQSPQSERNNSISTNPEAQTDKTKVLLTTPQAVKSGSTNSADSNVNQNSESSSNKIDTKITSDSSLRIVVNLPACQLSLIENGQVIKTYPVTIAAPKYAMPITPFEASYLIWNPSWTPPPSPWAAREHRRGPGEAGNPLGPMKIRLGGAYLIHGGGDKSVGHALSHGCIRMRNEDVLDLAKLIIDARKLPISAAQFAQFTSNRKREVGIKIDPIIPVEIKYQTITVADKQIALYPDVYRRGTNSLDKLKSTLAEAGIDYEKLNSEDQLALAKIIKDGVDKIENFEVGKNITATQEVADNLTDKTAAQ